MWVKYGVWRALHYNNFRYKQKIKLNKHEKNE